MEFQRARSAEQKALRTGQIMDAAYDLLQSHAYRDISLDMIAARLDFSRANMARYAATKEEIFLMLFVREMDGMVDDFEEGYGRKHPLGIDAFARFCTGVIATYPAFLHIGSILGTVIEMNIAPERLAAYKARMYANMQRMAGILRQNFPFLGEEAALDLVGAMTALVNGVYPASKPTENQAEAMRLCGVEGQPDFEETLARYFALMLRGFEAAARRQ